RINRSVEALPWARSAVEREPKNFAYLDTLGQVLLETGDALEAETHLRKSFQLLKRVGTLVGLARALAAQGRYLEAAATGEEAIALSKGSWPPNERPEEEVRQWIAYWKASVPSA
ncbi:MAG TPA: hypothetical protein VNT75_12895, partial [Symbiobacteriaceae bacterium]|nr:hypothetical protein [Symbiobacteriaceae bacterium]